jgi:uncharacterized protein YkwD
MFAVLRPRFACRLVLLGPAVLWLCSASPAQGDGTVAGPAPHGESLAWSGAVWSPQPQTGSGLGHTPLTAACHFPDAALLAVAADIAARKSAAPDAELLTWSVRAAGSPYVRPRALLLSGKRIDPADAAGRLGAWLTADRRDGQRQCAVATARRADGTEAVAAVLADAEAHMDPVPVRARVSSWITVSAAALVPATNARLVVLGPSGPPRTVPTSFTQGRVFARANLDRPGPWTLQLLLTTAAGPHPVLETTVFAGVDPPTTPLAQPAPGESSGHYAGDPAAQLFEMMNAARASEGLDGLAYDAQLCRVAERHSRRMLDAHQIGHDLGDGDPAQRVESSGIAAHEVGENVAHAKSASLAHRAVWSSPSHRANLLDQRFGRAGVGVSTDAQGTVWVAYVFASTR